MPVQLPSLCDQGVLETREWGWGGVNWVRKRAKPHQPSLLLGPVCDLPAAPLSALSDFFFYFY